jgi:hypothetical protein
MLAEPSCLLTMTSQWRLAGASRDLINVELWSGGTRRKGYVMASTHRSRLRKHLSRDLGIGVDGLQGPQKDDGRR